jgi:hypothetical protein
VTWRRSFKSSSGLLRGRQGSEASVALVPNSAVWPPVPTPAPHAFTTFVKLFSPFLISNLQAAAPLLLPAPPPLACYSGIGLQACAATAQPQQFSSRPGSVATEVVMNSRQPLTRLRADQRRRETLEPVSECRGVGQTAPRRSSQSQGVESMLT